MSSHSSLGVGRRTLHDSASNLPQSTDLLERYRGLVALGKISFDEDQVRVVMQLRRLQKELIDYAPPSLALHHTHSEIQSREEPGKSSPWWVYSHLDEGASDERALVRVKGQAEELAELDSPKGLLLTGPPGSGKSFLVDMWFASLPTPYKVRKHYSQLVLEIYRAVWEETQRLMATVHSSSPATKMTQVPWNRAIRDQWRALVGSGALPPNWNWSRRPPYTSSGKYSPEPTIAFVVAKRLLLTHWLLVFDEVQLLDVSSANLLADVLSWFWRLGGVVVGTSNKVPEDLYQNGVSKERLEGFVTALKARCPTVEMTGAKDWRLETGGMGEGRTWFTTNQHVQFQEMLSSLTASHEPKPETLRVFGRPMEVPWASQGICKFTFAQVCHETIGPADYLTLASTYHTIVITHIPKLNFADKNQARRFISLIDALYEARCRILCMAECEPEGLFFPDTSPSLNPQDVDVMMAEAVSETQGAYRPNVSSYDAPSMGEAPVARVSSGPLDTLSIFSGQDEQFAFKRALSRLIEMTSPNYRLTAHWTPLPASLRKWEEPSEPPLPGSLQSLPPVPRTSTAPRTDNHFNHVDGDSDFAAEAAYAQRENHAPGVRPEAPRLGQEHVWGVRDDWGPRARAWGRGARAFSDSDPDSKSR
ncbi:hypothetical protein FIBSPDRAFT_739626 [Athelia psychrophila]|uniref:AFG1-like ATPase n=1 Tax=Athelia psychrophila TaxID=1759441 RepID=A0A166KMB5_9AGAM|nr:hypothetical protein FIBSPDRAFT_739626 [Fibularhizoctonia sp. CBS 109695]